jgi:endogenous inhibitor of DNA gyrase (YacG/DUF329 family)
MAGRVLLICPVCEKAFRRYGGHIRTTSPTCSNRCRGLLRGAPRAAWAAWKQKADDRVQTQVQVYFGRLSERELAIFRHAWKVAYQRGRVSGRRKQAA